MSVQSTLSIHPHLYPVQKKIAVSGSSSFHATARSNLALSYRADYQLLPLVLNWMLLTWQKRLCMDLKRLLHDMLSNTLDGNVNVCHVPPHRQKHPDQQLIILLEGGARHL